MSDDDLLDMSPEPTPYVPNQREVRAQKQRDYERLKRQRRSGKAAPAEKAAPTEKAAPNPNPGHDATVVQALLRPVSITFLANVLGMDRVTVAKKLAPLPPIGTSRGGGAAYDFKQSLQYLVTPRADVADAIRRIGVDDLPVSLQKDVWEARLKAQTWRERAGELWRTDDVLEVLGEAFQRLKTTTQLWIDQIVDNHSFPPAARAELIVLVDSLQADLHRALVEMPEEKATRAQEAEIEGTPLDD